LSELKKSQEFSSLSMHTPLISSSSSAPAGDLSNAHQNKIYSYENRLHVAMKNSSQLSSNGAYLPGTPDTGDYQVSNVANPSSGSSRYSSQIMVNLNSVNDASQQKSLENDINILKNKLKETEISLKKEQTEKYLIEYKLKQQQQDNDLQMRSIINR